MSFDTLLYNLFTFPLTSPEEPPGAWVGGESPPLTIYMVHTRQICKLSSFPSLLHLQIPLCDKQCLHTLNTLQHAPKQICDTVPLVCVCVASLSMYPISHTHSSTARCATVYSRPITRLSVKRLEFIRDTESRWQLPTDLTCVYKRRWSDPRGGYHQVNKDIVSLERSIKKWAKTLGDP